jgi:hypothetical protein
MLRRYYAIERGLDREVDVVLHFYSREERDAWVAEKPDVRQAITANKYHQLVG